MGKPIQNDNKTPAAFELYASKAALARREKIGLINRLSALGVQGQIELPCITVIGSQSVGKSSLIESVSGIQLPRDSGTCTKARFEVRLTKSDADWSCRVGLRRVQENSNAADEPFGDVLFDSADVEDRLRRAQVALLNPAVSISAILKHTDAEITALKKASVLPFTRSIVVVSVTGPDVENLSFIDLPGLIGVGPDVDFVKDLVESSIQKNAIILLTLSMKDDYDNQSAVEFARRADPEGKWTLGVCTKSDTLEAGDHHNWMKIVNGIDHKLKHGYFVVKQPNTSELTQSLSIPQRRELEANFFRDTEPWSQLGTERKTRLGTPNLVKCLEIMLSYRIDDQIPKIQQSIETLLHEYRDQLHTLPPAPSVDPIPEINGRLARLVADLENISEGRRGFTDAVQQAHALYDRFQTAVCATVPVFVPFSPESPRFKNYTFPTYAKPWVPKSFVASGALPEAESFERPSTMASFLKPGILDAQPGTFNAQRRPIQVVDEEKMKGIVWHLDDISCIIANHRSMELPGNVPYPAQEWFSVQVTAKWDIIATALLLHFDGFDNNELKRRVSHIVTQQIDEAFDVCTQQISLILLYDKQPFTLNTHYLQASTAKLLAHFKDARDTSNPSYSEAEKLAIMGNTLAELRKLWMHATMDDLKRVAASDEKADELQLMAATYGLEGAHCLSPSKVAYKRFLDNIPRCIYAHIFRRLGDSMLERVLTSLDLSGDEGLAKAESWVAQDKQTVARRNELVSNIKQLEEAAREVAASIGH